MSVLLDIILAFILAVCTFIGYKHGLIRTLSKFISYIVAFTLANNFYVVVAIPLFEPFALTVIVTPFKSGV
jgi:uncharacterized membrane protein required for colicin V production